MEPQVSNRHPPVPGWGVDASFDRRPGVPRLKTRPSPVPGGRSPIHRQTLPPDPPTVRMELKEVTPVFGTAQLPHGASGRLRRIAYGYPEHLARHWLLLLLADRVDVLGHRFRRVARRTALGSAFAGLGFLAVRGLRH